jgi:aminoglycoside phosphotransferase (APT) family kinase protein
MVARAPKGIDAARVTGWLADHVEGAVPPFDFELITGGHSNLTYKVTDRTGRRYVLRRPPLGAVLATAHDMAREHKIVTGVGRTDVPVPRTLGLCRDEAVNGAPFYVMEFVDGAVLTTADDVIPLLPDEGSRHALGSCVIRVLASLHRVDPDAVGLGDLARREGYLDLAAKPEQKYTGIVHGDYRLGNMLVRRDGAVAAVLDWELCTLGDTLADLGYVLNNWIPPEEAAAGDASIAPTAAGGFQTREEFLREYSQASGHEVSDIEYYRAFQAWRSAAIVEGVLARYLKGVMGDPSADVDGFRRRVELAAENALTLVRSLR